MTSYIVVRVADAHRQELLAAADRHRLARDASEARSRFPLRRAGIRTWVKSATQLAMPERSRRAAARMPSAPPMNS
jgi:hypothetical protein